MAESDTIDATAQLAEPGGWRTFLPDNTYIEHEGKPIPLREHPILKETKDLPTLAQRLIESQKEISGRVRLPGKDAKPEERAAFDKRLIEAGLKAAPLEKPEDYGIARPEKLPEGLGWNDEWAGEFAKTLHKHVASKELAADLLALHEKVMLGTQEGLKGSMDEGFSALKREFGDKYEQRMAQAERVSKAIFKTPEEVAFFEALGLGNHPAFLSIMMRIAPLIEQDSSYMRDINRGDGSMDREGTLAELRRIMTDKTHPMYEGFQRRDPAVQRHIDEMYAKTYGTEPVELGQGIHVTGKPS